jgi:hypothetical protein
VPVEQLGEHQIEVTHFGQNEVGEQVQATESAAFSIRAMGITVIDIVPGGLGLIWVGGDGGGGTISGKVFDWVTGAGISGATVVFGNYFGTTDLSGAYSITVPDSVSTVDGTLAAFKGLEYTFLATAGISIDPTTDPVYNIGLAPTDASAYPGRNLAGRIYDNTGAELSVGSRLEFYFINENGGQQRVTQNYGPAGYSLNTKTFGSDCFVNVVARDEPNPFSVPLLQFYLKDQDLSVDLDPYDHPYDLNQPPDENFTTVTANGTGGTMFYGFLVVPNRGWAGIAGEDFNESSNVTLKLYNPDDFQMGWLTQTVDPDTPEPGVGTFKISVAMLPFSDTINLPAAYTQAAPLGAVDGTSVDWDSSTGTLSFDEVNGANGYWVFLRDDDGYSSTLFSNSSSIAFPSKLVMDILDAGAGWDLTVWPIYSPQATPAKLVDFSLSMDPTVDLADPTGSGVSVPRMECQAAALMIGDVTKVDAIP